MRDSFGGRDCFGGLFRHDFCSAATTTDPRDRYSGTPDSVTIPALEESKQSSVYYGDVDFSSSVTAVDALLTLQNSVGKVGFSATVSDRANVDGSKDENGNATVTPTDAPFIFSARPSKKDIDFPAEKAVVEQALNMKVKLKCHEDGTFTVLQVSDFQDNCNANETIKDGTMQRF